MEKHPLTSLLRVYFKYRMLRTFYLFFSSIDLVFEGSLFKVMLVTGSFGQGSYERTRLWAYFKASHEFSEVERPGTMFWNCHQGCHLLGIKL